MKYKNYLNNKNLAVNTINAYTNHVEKWLLFLNGKEPNKTLFVKYIKKVSNKYSANTVRLIYSSIISYIKFLKKWNLVRDFHDIKLPSIVHCNKTTISLNETNVIQKRIIFQKWIDHRNWLIFLFIFYTGIRCSELKCFSKDKIYETNKVDIKGKGNKTRTIFLPKILLIELKKWNVNKINVASNGKELTEKQINLIIKNIGIKKFNKNITCHSLRRSYATNLLRMKVDIKTVSKLMGHSNINTTARYIHFTDEEIISKLEKVFT